MYNNNKEIENKMEEKTEVFARYPQNLKLKEFILSKGIRFAFIAKEVGVNKTYFGDVLNGHTKGENIKEKTRQWLINNNYITAQAYAALME